LTKKAHLLGFVQHGVNSHATGMWRHPKDKVGWNYARPEYWQHMARVMERGLFDAMFIADELAPYNTHGGSSDPIVKYAVQCPTHEPSTIAPIITGSTKNLGVGVTLSTAFEHPYSICRRLSSLDHLSEGRVAWTIVSSYSKSEWDAYGAEMTERADRYGRLEEYMELCYKLWNSWEDGAIIADKASGIYADPAKVREINHAGEYFRCKGRHFVAPSPQGQPVLWQAGSSDRGRDFAAKHAEAIKLIYGVQTVVAETRSEAQAKYERIRDCIPPEGALAWMSGHFGLDFSKFNLDEHIQNIEVPGIQGLFESILYARDGAPVTVREAAMIYAQGMGMPVLVGTPSDVADQLEIFMEEGGADGFMLIATYTPGCFEEFVDLGVPELQRRHRYRTAYAGSTLRENLLEY
jgi:alkanesulfonate monooxygenase SsuD/methylene tetrahydromethanopterin reductase-like flavin-dependent oxidoreductase (luciferase family)